MVCPNNSGEIDVSLDRPVHKLARKDRIGSENRFSDPISFPKLLCRIPAVPQGAVPGTAAVWPPLLLLLPPWPPQSPAAGACGTWHERGPPEGRHLLHTRGRGHNRVLPFLTVVKGVFVSRF